MSKDGQDPINPVTTDKGVPNMFALLLLSVRLRLDAFFAFELV